MVGLVVDDLHAAAAEHVRGPYQHWVADLVGDALRLVKRASQPVFWSRQVGFGQDAAKCPSFLGQVDRFGTGADDRDSRVLERLGEAERGLSAQLHDDTCQWSRCLLGVYYFQYVFQRQRLEVQPVGSVVVGWEGPRVRIALFPSC